MTKHQSNNFDLASITQTTHNGKYYCVPLRVGEKTNIDLTFFMESLFDRATELNLSSDKLIATWIEAKKRRDEAIEWES